jgi:hypothetical protein
MPHALDQGMSHRSSAGTGYLRSGQRSLGPTAYQIHVGMPNTPGTVVELESPPIAQDGEVLELTLEDGSVLLCHVRGASPYCRVLGERPKNERRANVSPENAPIPAGTPPRRRSDARGTGIISYPCPRCMATRALVTHRGIMMATLFCLACRHGWGEPPAALVAATRLDRRTATREDSVERRSDDRLPAPACGYCGTDAFVRPLRRTPHEVFFVCTGCEAMWALPRPQSAYASRPTTDPA